MKINKESGLPLQIYIPNLQRMQSFEMEFYTNPTAPKAMNIVISYDGTTYVNCAPWEKGVYFYTERKFSSLGDVLCRATYYVPTPNVVGGVQKIVMAGIATGITIVAEGGSYFDPIGDPSKLTVPSFNDPSCNHIPIFMTYYPSGEKGDIGPQGIQGITGATGAVGATGPQGIAGKDAGIDYSKLTEQIVPGVFLSDLNGVKRQAYVRTFYGVIGATPTDFRIALKSAVNEGNGYIIMGQIGGVPPAYTRDFGGSAYWTYYTSGGFAHIKVAGSPSLSNAKYAFTFIYY